jgi:hypothetical protein
MRVWPAAAYAGGMTAQMIDLSCSANLTGQMENQSINIQSQ